MDVKLKTNPGEQVNRKPGRTAEKESIHPLGALSAGWVDWARCCSPSGDWIVSANLFKVWSWLDDINRECSVTVLLLVAFFKRNFENCFLKCLLPLLSNALPGLLDSFPAFVLAVVFWFSWCDLRIRGTTDDSCSGKRQLSCGVPLERQRSPWMGA